MLEQISLSKNEFRHYFIEPIEKEFDCRVYWYGKETIKAGLGTIPINEKGVTLTNREKPPIILKYTSNTFDLLMTLLHEIGHFCLHSNNQIHYSVAKETRELEAEFISVYTLMGMGIDCDTSYLTEWENRYNLSHQNNFSFDKAFEEFSEYICKLCDILQPNFDLIISLVDHK